jgi:hypothetical protein
MFLIWRVFRGHQVSMLDHEHLQFIVYKQNTLDKSQSNFEDNVASASEKEPVSYIHCTS